MRSHRLRRPSWRSARAIDHRVSCTTPVRSGSGGNGSGLLRGFLSGALFDAGLYCRADDRGDPVIQLSPPLICGQEHFDEIEESLRKVLTEASTLL